MIVFVSLVPTFGGLGSLLAIGYGLRSCFESVFGPQPASTEQQPSA